MTMQSTVEPHIHQVVDILKAIPDCQSIWLLGSMARGEASVLQSRDDHLEFFSDIELMVVVPQRLPAPIGQRVVEKLTMCEQHLCNPNPLFHIDVLLRERSRLAAMAPIIFTYELKQNARLLYGEDVRAEIPDVTLANLDFRNTREILYKRLWAILLHLPKRFVLGEASEAERRVAGYVLCRNALDLTTVFLPHDGVLLPTYRDRVAYMRDHYTDLSLIRRFDPDFLDFLQFCLDRRVDLDFAGVDLYELYRKTLEYLERGLVLLLPDASAGCVSLPAHAHHIFNEWPISRGEWYNLARLTLKITRRAGPLRALAWLRLPKKGWLTLGLLSLHKALLAWFAGKRAVADDHLLETARILGMVACTPVEIEPNAEFTARWFALREHWGKFWQQYIRLGASAYHARFAEIMEWTHE